MSGSAGSRRRSGGAGRISRSDRMVSGRRWGSPERGSLIRHFQSLRRRRRRGAGRRRGRIFRSVRTAGMGCGSAGTDVRRVIRCWSSRCRRMRCAAEGAGGCMRGTFLPGVRVPAVGYAGGDPAGADGGGARAVCGGALRGLSALRLRGLDKEESAGVLGEVLLLSLCGDPDDRTFCHDVGCEKSASCFPPFLALGRVSLRFLLSPCSFLEKMVK